VFAASLMVMGGATGQENCCQGLRGEAIQLEAGVFERGCRGGGDFLPSGDAAWIIGAEMLAPLSGGRVVLELETKNLAGERREVCIAPSALRGGWRFHEREQSPFQLSVFVCRRWLMGKGCPAGRGQGDGSSA